MNILIDADGKEFEVDSAQNGARIPIVHVDSDSTIITQPSSPAWTSHWGITGTFVSAPTGTAGAVTDVPPVGMCIVVTDILVAGGANVTSFTFSEETSGFVITKIAAGLGLPFLFQPRSKLKLPTPGKRLMVISTLVNTYTYVGYYYESP